MEVVRTGETPVFLNPRGVRAKKLLDKAAVQVTDLLLQPGERVDTHVTPVDVFFYVVSGRGTVEIGAEKEAVQAQDLVFSPKNVPHALQAAEDAPFEVLVVKTPNPARGKGG
ncbi:MAG: cupin domain-containing protein [Desulfotomaculales bacterium]